MSTTFSILSPPAHHSPFRLSRYEETMWDPHGGGSYPKTPTRSTKKTSKESSSSPNTTKTTCNMMNIFPPSKTPTKTPTSKTPRKTPRTPGHDRFIPALASDYEISHFNITKQEDVTPLTPTHYRETLADTMFEGKPAGTRGRILAFKDKAPLPKEPQHNSMHALYTHTQTTMRKVTNRVIPQTPECVLDAPDYPDDYYLNLLDWGVNNTLAIGLGESVYLWNAVTRETTPLLDSIGNQVTSVAWGNQAQHLAVGLNDSTIQLWDVQKQKRVRTLMGHTGRVGSLAWNQHILSSGSRDAAVLNHDVRASGGPVSTLTGHTAEVCGLAWSLDGKQLASGGNDNRVNIWNIDGNPSIPRFSFPDHIAAVRALAWCPWEANLLASGGGTADRCIRFWNTSTGACLNTVDTRSQVCSLVWAKHERELVSAHGFSENQLAVWKYPAMRKLGELKGHTSRVLGLAMSPDGETVASVAGDETLRFWVLYENKSKHIIRTKKPTQTMMSANIR